MEPNRSKFGFSSGIGVRSDVLSAQRYWRRRAEQVRIVSEEMRDPICRRIMEDVAKSYDDLATRALDVMN
jgi:hypothetical protein